MMLSSPSPSSHTRARTAPWMILVGLFLFPLLSLQAQALSPDTTGPVISVWTGQDMTFGALGIPQPILNILGNVSSERGIASLRYSLNGGSSHPLSAGPDERRLARLGDFNIDIRSDSLVVWPQVNAIVITATDTTGKASSANVRVTKRPPSRWPLPYSVTWSASTSLADSAQVTDGLWSWTPWGIQTAETGYDRLIAVGDTGWTDYEVTAEMTVLEVDTSDAAYNDINGGPAFGLILHWNGHTNNPVFTPPIKQPLSGYLPYGAIGCYHWNRSSASRWMLLGNNLELLAEDSTRGMEIGVPYLYRMRVNTIPGMGQRYSLKSWKESSQEPANWQLVGIQDSANPPHGSFLLYAHHVKGVFGKFLVEPLGPEIVMTGMDSLAGPNSAYITWSTNAKSTGKVLYGKSLSSPDTSRGDTLLSRVHHVLLPDLLPSTRYQINVVATAEDGAVIKPMQSTFTTATNQSPLAFKSDLFDSTSIGSRWVFINPDPPSTLSLIQNASTQALSIAIPSGSGHDIWSGMNAPRIMQPATDMDFQAEAKFLSLPSVQYQDQGILVEQDADNFIRVDFFSDATGVNAFTASFEAGVPTVRGKVQIAPQSPLFLRLTRSGNLWKSFFSHDSIHWTMATSFTSTMRLNAIGLYSGNAPGQDSSAPAFTSITDHFINLVEQADDVPLTPPQGPNSYALAQNYPNPFNPVTTIKYAVGGTRDAGRGAGEAGAGGSQPASGLAGGLGTRVKLAIYDLLGREVATLVNEPKMPGNYEVRFDGSGLATGVYVYRLTAGSFVQSRKMILVK